VVVTTRGRHGSRLSTRDGTVEVPAAPAARVVDPTGAGDAYRSGLLAGLLRGLDLERAGRIASVAASYVIEQTGTVEHRYSLDDLAARYELAYGEPAPAGFQRSSSPVGSAG
jgi:adenosine kinase